MFDYLCRKWPFKGLEFDFMWVPAASLTLCTLIEFVTEHPFWVHSFQKYQTVPAYMDSFLLSQQSITDGLMPRV